MKNDEGNFYEIEFQTAVTTQHILGEIENSLVRTIDFDDLRKSSYVSERNGLDGRDGGGTWEKEIELYELFWPTGNTGNQLIYVEGEPGIGKSTFLSYFFQHFVPYHPQLIAGETSKVVYNAHRSVYDDHIILYTDLRLPDGESLRPFLFGLLKRGVQEARDTKEIPGLGEHTQQTDEVWVRDRLCELAQKTNETGQRKYYVSWVIDNVDKLDARFHRELLGILSTYIHPDNSPSDWLRNPTNDIRRALWRVIVPVRPETATNYASEIGTWNNRVTVTLGQVNPNRLFATRAERLRNEIVAGGREFGGEFQPDPATRATWDGMTAGESANVLSTDLVGVLNIDNDDAMTTPLAKSIFEDLVDKSARRQLVMATRAITSPSFRAHRRILAGAKKTNVRISTHYFLEGLIRGSDAIFRPESSYILNLYDMGATPGSAHSVFVGLHAVFLLRNANHTWADAKRVLRKIGYGENDIAACQEALLDRDLIKKLWRGEDNFRIETRIVGAHWRLLNERAYTDNMAAACAERWSQACYVPLTDPSNPINFLTRIEGSLWFMKEIARREKDICRYSTSAKALGIAELEFMEMFESKRIESIAAYIATKYLTIARMSSEYEGPGKTINDDVRRWQNWCKQIEDLIREAQMNNPLSPEN